MTTATRSQPTARSLLVTLRADTVARPANSIDYRCVNPECGCLVPAVERLFGVTRPPFDPTASLWSDMGPDHARGEAGRAELSPGRGVGAGPLFVRQARCLAGLVLSLVATLAAGVSLDPRMGKECADVTS